MKERSATEQALSGFRLTGYVFLTILTAGALLAGATIVFQQGELDILFFPGPYPPLVGWILITFATVVITARIKQVVRLLPGLLLAAGVNALIALQTGHLINRPSIPISKQAAFFYLMFFVLSGLLLWPFNHRRLNVVDRIAVVAFVYCLVWTVFLSVEETYTAIIVGSLCLLIPWGFSRLRRNRIEKRARAIGQG